MKRRARNRRKRIAPGLALLVLACCGRARAEGYQLTWQRQPGAESCVSAESLKRLLDEVIDNTTEAGKASLVIDGSVAPASLPLRWQVKLHVTNAAGESIGERELDDSSPHCSELTRPLLLILAMSIDPNAAPDSVSDGVAAELRDAPVLGAPGRALPPAPTVRALPKPPRLRRAWQLLAGGALSVELLPRTSPGAALGGQLWLTPEWSVAMTVFAWPAQHAASSFESTPESNVRFAAAQANLELCRDLAHSSALRFGVCGGAGFGERWVPTSGLTQPANPWRSYWGALLGAQLDVRIAERWFVRGGVAGLASLRRERFTYFDRVGEVRELFTPSTFSGWALLGLGARL